MAHERTTAPRSNRVTRPGTWPGRRCMARRRWRARCTSRRRVDPRAAAPGFGSKLKPQSAGHGERRLPPPRSAVHLVRDDARLAGHAPPAAAAAETLLGPAESFGVRTEVRPARDQALATPPLDAARRGSGGRGAPPPHADAYRCPAAAAGQRLAGRSPSLPAAGRFGIRRSASVGSVGTLLSSRATPVAGGLQDPNLGPASATPT